MFIKHMQIENFRNLSNLNVNFNKNLNFIIGENDLGKSNLIDLFYIIFNKSFFSEEDFFSQDKDIEITFELGLDQSEIGIFGDCISENGESVNIKISQSIEDDKFKVLCSNNGENLSSRDLKCINFVKYSSVRKPEEDFNISINRGIHKVFRYIIEKSIEKSKVDSILNEKNVEEIINHINDIFQKVSIFKDFKFDRETELNELVLRILKIKDYKNLDIFKSGHGIQFSLVVILYIWENLLKINEKKSNCVFGDVNEKSISLVLGLDEPEIHLHPYMQRRLIKEINKILENNNNEFLEVLKDIFNTSNNIRINGQIFVVTHSPYILGDDLKQIIRFYSDNGKIKVISGNNLDISEKEHKHIMKNFDRVKEAFFSRCVILIEGDTEEGAIPLWSKKIIGDLDNYGIVIINVGGGDSLAPVKRALNHFEIPAVVIIDRDKLGGYPSDLKDDSFFHTNYKDIEEEIANEVYSYLMQNEDNTEQKTILVKILNEIKGREDFSLQYLENLINKGKEKFIEKIYKNLKNGKSITTGKILGEYLPENLIPEVYKEALRKAKELAERSNI